MTKSKITKAIIDKKKRIPLTDKQLLVGYNQETYEPIVVDMGITAHLFICGLSQCGKSRMVEFAIKDKNVILMNVFKHDFKSLKKALRVNGYDKIKAYLKNIVTKPYYRETPLYIVIDELLVLCTDKDVVKAITDLLAVGRHYNIYIIGISQVGDKESVKFKNLFNARICFRAVEDSSYRTVLGYTPENLDLLPRQFHLYSHELAFGRTYDIRPGQ